MELRRYLAILRNRIFIIVLTVVAAIVAAWITTPRDPSYVATAKIYVGVTRLLPTNAQPIGVNDLVTGLKSVVTTYAAMIDSRPIAEQALQTVPAVQRSPETVVDSTTVSPVGDTLLLNVSVSDVDPAAAQQLANAMVDAFVERIQSLDPAAPPQPGQPPQLPAYVFERAALPGAPEPTGAASRLVVSALFGFLAASALAFLLEYLDITLKSPRDAEDRLELTVLGVIPLGAPEPIVADYAVPPVAAS